MPYPLIEWSQSLTEFVLVWVFSECMYLTEFSYNQKWNSCFHSMQVFFRKYLLEIWAVCLVQILTHLSMCSYLAIYEHFNNKFTFNCKSRFGKVVHNINLKGEYLMKKNLISCLKIYMLVGITTRKCKFCCFLHFLFYYHPLIVLNWNYGVHGLDINVKVHLLLVVDWARILQGLVKIESLQKTSSSPVESRRST